MKLNNTSENHLVYQYHQHFYQMYVCVHNNGVHHDAQDTNLLKLRIQQISNVTTSLHLRVFDPLSGFLHIVSVWEQNLFDLKYVLLHSVILFLTCFKGVVEYEFLLPPRHIQQHL